MDLTPDAATVALIVSGVALILATIALLIVLLRQPPHPDTPVEGISGLDDALDRDGREVPTQRLPSRGAGTVYAGSHRRTGPGKWLAHMGRADRGWAKPTVQRVPRPRKHS